MTDIIDVRQLAAADAVSYRVLRLHGLQHDPRAFTGCYNEEFTWDLSEFEKRISENIVFGAFIGADLVGKFGLHLHTQKQLQHKATVWGMYVHPKARGRGVANILMQNVLQYARQQPELEHLILAVTASNKVVSRWYEKLGFRLYAVEPEAVKFDDDYEDDEWRILAL